jgi:hypothetical protein
VAHAAPSSAGPWRVGCAFDVPLSPDDLEAFLRYTGRFGPAFLARIRRAIGS